MSLPDRPPPYRTIVFDCDSTLSAMEGILELAPPELAAEIESLTSAAMAGEVALEEVFGRRLELVRPSRADLERVGRAYVEHAVPHARELVGALLALGKRLIVVSGGLLPPVRHLAAHLGIEEVHAVDVRLDGEGGYAGFDAASPLARSGGKIDVLREIAASPRAAPVVLIGDGATDLEAAHVVDRFVAFGGVVRREGVFAASRVTCEGPDFRSLVPLLLDEDELGRLRSGGRGGRFASLLEHAPSP